MKKISLLFLVMIFIASNTLLAQTKSSPKSELPVADVSTINAQLDVFKNEVTNTVQITALDIEKFDKISVVDKKGAVVLRKTVNTSIANMDFSGLEDGVYVLGLFSSANMIEKSIKFIIRR